MKNILVSIEAGHPARARSAVEQAVRLYREQAVDIHLLLVQPRVTGHVAAFFSPDALREAQLEWGLEDLKPARAFLDEAGVPYHSMIRIGRSADTIAAQARELHCERIIFGDEPPGLAARLFGTVAQQVRQILHAQGDPVVMGS